MRYLHTIIFVWLCYILNAQELKVTSIKPLTQDISARTQACYDNNGERCALFKVNIPGIENVTFQSDYIMKTEYRGNEYWVYIVQGIKKLKISHKNFFPCEVTIGDFYSEGISTGSTYQMNVKVIQENSNTTLAIIRTNVRNASMVIDGKNYSTTDGELDVALTKGVHSYTVSTPVSGFTPTSGQFSINGTDAIEQVPMITLPNSMKYTLSLSAENDVKYKINGKEMSKTGNVTETLAAGMYDVEAYVGDGSSWYKREKVDLTQGDVALNMSLSGTLQFSSPKDAFFDIKPLDGAISPSKNKFATNEIIHALGSYSVTVSKKGYDPKTLNISVVPGENKRKAQLVSKADKLYHGWDGVEKDLQKAAKEYEKLASKGDDAAQFMLGQCYYDNNASGSAIEWWSKSAAQGNTDAMISLAKMESSISKKIELLKQPAQEGNKEAEYLLGVAYAQDGNSQNKEMAVEWLTRANEHGMRNSGKELGSIYLSQQKYDEAYSNLISASDNEEGVTPEMLTTIGDVYLNGSNNTARDFVKAKRCYEAAAKIGSEYAKEKLADYMYYGYGGTPVGKDGAMRQYEQLSNPNNALKYRIAIYLLSERNDTTGAAHWLERIDDPNFTYLDGMGDCFFKIANKFYKEQDKARGVNFFEKAAALGCQDRKMSRIIGVEYFNGKNVPQDFTKALIFLKRGHEEKDRLSTRFLGLCYERGNGVIVDRAMAKQLYEEAIKLGDIVSYSYLGTMYYQESDIEKAMAIWKIGGKNGDKKSIQNIIKYLSVKTDDRSKAEIQQWQQQLNKMQ